jgi:2'-5' RNA ligase
MRVFVGLDIDEAIRGRIAEFVGEVRGFAPEVRWVAAESLHVTLKFIGEKPDGVVAKIEKALGMISGESFEISFRGYGFFPTVKAARVFWVGIEAGEGPGLLAGAVEEKLAEIGIAKEDRAFSPHLTLARGGARIGSGSGAPGRRSGDRVNCEVCEVAGGCPNGLRWILYDCRPRVLLPESLSPKGSRYSKVRFELKTTE